jgi:5'-deoxynucleotidase YfbR-like HD superfamily hydrolase
MSLTTQQKQLIHHIDARFPARGIAANFNRYAATRPEHRVALAILDLQALPRRGWERIGVPLEDRQSVYQHQFATVQLINEMTHHYPLPYATKAAMMAFHHDTTEAVVSDFTPVDKITKQEKCDLESAAADIIFTAHPNLRKNWQEFEDKKTDAAQCVHDADVVELACRARFLGERHPQLAKPLVEFFEYAQKKVTTDHGVHALSTLMKGRNGGIYGRMKQLYSIK